MYKIKKGFLSQELFLYSLRFRHSFYPIELLENYETNTMGVNYLDKSSLKVDYCIFENLPL